MSDLQTLVAQEVQKKLATFTADATVKKVLEFLKNHNSAFAYVVDKGESGEIGWRVWSDGLIEQWLIIRDETYNGDVTANKTFTFVKPYSNTSYALIGNGLQLSEVNSQKVQKSTSGFSTSSYRGVAGTGGWYVIGY